MENTEVKIERLSDGCWIELQYHSAESVCGWAFCVGGSSVGSVFNWEYGYPSENEARNVAIDVAEELVKTRIRNLTRELGACQQSLEKIQQLQQKKCQK